MAPRRRDRETFNAKARRRKDAKSPLRPCLYPAPKRAQLASPRVKPWGPGRTITTSPVRARLKSRMQPNRPPQAWTTKTTNHTKGKREGVISAVRRLVAPGPRPSFRVFRVFRGSCLPVLVLPSARPGTGRRAWPGLVMKAPQTPPPPLASRPIAGVEFSPAGWPLAWKLHSRSGFAV